MVTVTRENFHLILPYKTKILIEDLSETTSQQTARLQKGYSACAESKNQWKFSRVTVTVTVTVKATEVNAQSP